uniref:Cpn60 n=2 Tax=Stygiella incarcerata TaxID=1712417 RepID=A0A192ZI77_9EUKA|nr:Cpn60 [Stygiella incarcerata]
MLQSLSSSLQSGFFGATKVLGGRLFSHGKDIRYGRESRDGILRGVIKLAEAVAVTLGPKGRNVIIEQSYGAPRITKDGVSVAKAVEFKDKHENLGAQLVKSVASKTNDVAGDGTTTATVLTRSLFAEGCKAVAAGMNPMDIKRGIDKAVSVVMEQLKKNSKSISSRDEIAQVATISANGESAIGDLIAEAMDRVGKEGVITVQDGKTLENELEVVEGMKFDRGYISPYFVTDSKTLKCEMEDPWILLYDKKISTLQSIIPILEESVKSQKPLVMIAEDVDGEALATLVVNKLRGGLKVVAVKAPGFGDNRKANLQDIAVLTGAQVISEEVGMTLEKVDKSMLGSCKKVTISKEDTIILDGAGEKSDINERCEVIRRGIEDSTSDYEKEKFQERLAKLSGGVAVIKVGGGSEIEVNERKDRITDALNATRAAVAEGIVAGGGVALLNASKALDSLHGDSFDQDVGIRAVKDAIRKPTKLIADNGGAEGAVVVEKILSSDSPFFGYDAAVGEYGDLVQRGVIDPLKVVRTALSDASSVASMLITAETSIVDLPEEKSSSPPMGGAPGGMGGGMPGMGGMGGMGEMF